MSDVTSFMLPIVFGISLALAVAIYVASGRIRAKPSSESSGKSEAYACGESMPVEDLKVDLERFLVFAVYFLIFDVLAFTMATSFLTLGLAPVAYSLIVLAAVAMLIVSGRHQ
jgi:NADH:ubiquinone oxidoreductase subunit 3 (subunit A)